jgi:hypothetical protein
MLKEDGWLSRKEASAYLRGLGFPLAPATLAKMAANNNQGNGPPFTRFRWSIVRYRAADLAAWVKNQSKRVS